VGQHRITTIDLTTEAADEKRPSKKVVEAVEAETAEAAKKPRRKKVRSKRYQHLRGMVDRTKTYPLAEAVALVKKTTYAKFGGSIRADVVLTDNKLQTEIAFTHPTGKKIKVAIASETLLDEVEKGKLDFDILVASPEMMPKIDASALMRCLAGAPFDLNSDLTIGMTLFNASPGLRVISSNGSPRK